MFLKSLLICSILPAVALAEDKVAWEGKTVRQWAQQLADRDIGTSWYAGYVLGQLGPRAAEAVGPLRKVLEKRSEQEYVRGNAAWALGRIGPRAESAIPLLTDTLQSRGHVSVRRNSAEALGNFGPAAKSAVPRLVQALGDDDMIVRVDAALALWKIQRHPKAVAALVEMLRHGDPAAAYRAAVALGSVNVSGTGHHAGMVGVPLEAMDKTAVSALVEAFHHADADVRRAAARSAGEFGAAALPALEKTLAERDEEVRRTAVEALGWMGPEAVAPLVRALKDKAVAPRRAAARALGRLGPAAKAAETALLDAVNDTDNDVRAAAAKALRRVRGG